MKPEKLTIQEIFSRERRFIIPLFQRSYVWNREEQWEPLWEDIQGRAEAHLERLGKSIEGKPRSHFLGAIVLNVASFQGRSIARSDVIDGQQRLTTLQLFLAALRDQSIALDAAEKDAKLFARLTRNPDCEEGAEDLFKVWPTNADRETFAIVMRASGRTALEKEFAGSGGGLPRMAQAYLYFSDAIADFVTSKEAGTTVEDRFYGLMMALKESLQLIVIELEEGDDPQIIFETLNARGQPLLPSDLIRNYVFMRITDKESERLYQAYWQHFDDERVEVSSSDGESRFWHIEERQGRLNRPRIDLFIFHYLAMHTENDIRIGQLFKEFRDWREASAQTNEEFLKDLKSTSGHFRRLIAPSGNSRLEMFARRLRSLDTSTVYPLLLFLASLEIKPGSNPEIDQCVADLESFMIRRFMCDLTPKNYNRFFMSVLGKAKAAHGNGKSVGEAIREELSRSALETNRWPDDKEFKKGWRRKQLYVRSRPDRAVMILSALEDVKRTSKNEKVTIQSGLTVEHLLPQSASLEIYPYSDVELEDGLTHEDDRVSVMHTVGNLTLLTGPLNSSISNGPFPRKATEIGAESDLRLNAWLRSNPPKGWNEWSAWERSKELGKLAVGIWPKPQPAPE